MTCIVVAVVVATAGDFPGATVGEATLPVAGSSCSSLALRSKAMGGWCVDYCTPFARGREAKLIRRASFSVFATTLRAPLPVVCAYVFVQGGTVL